MNAGIELRKKNLQNWLSGLNDESIIFRLELFKRENVDWWNIISEEEKDAIDDGISQLDKGEYISNPEMRAEIKKKYGF